MGVKIKRIILDTNVLYSGLYSSQGASFQILSAIEKNKIKPILSTALLFEYEEILNSNLQTLGLSARKIKKILDYFCLKSEHQNIYFLWRPCLTDPKDDHVLELAVASGAEFIVTHNTKDFKAAGKFNLKVITPKKLLEVL